MFKKRDKIRKKCQIDNLISELGQIQHNYHTMMSQCSGLIKRRKCITNRQLCAELDETHDKLYKLSFHFATTTSYAEDAKPYIPEIKNTLHKIYTLISNSYIEEYNNNGREASYYKRKDPEFIRPVSSRQANRADAVLVLLKEQRFIEAFHELYDTIDDNGTQYKKWDDQYKTTSCNELVLFKCLIISFNTALDIAYPEFQSKIS